MVQLINLDKYPVPFQNFIKNDEYQGGEFTDLSATGLLQPPRIRKLKFKHNSDIVEDAKRRVAAVFGTAVHSVMEQHCPDHWILEKRFYATVKDKVISGQIDAIEPLNDQSEVKIWDWKVIPSFKAMSGMKDYETQGNIYAYLVRKNGYIPVKFVIGALVKDWSQANADRNPNYPQLPIQSYEYEIWEEDRIQKYIEERVELHYSDDLPECTDEDMWTSDEKWEAKKKGHTRATKVFDTEREAQIWIAEGDHKNTRNTTIDDWDVTKRPSVRRRCESDWCGVARFCDQFAQYQLEKEFS
tara:strand:- start:622 stop:1518 length:897 start_codon:yes stop_codon:yes gene_type:complete